MRVAPKERHKMLTGSHLTVCLHFNSIIVIDCGGCYGLNFAYVAVEPWLEPACYHSLLLSLFLLLLFLLLLHLIFGQWLSDKLIPLEAHKDAERQSVVTAVMMMMVKISHV